LLAAVLTLGVAQAQQPNQQEVARLAKQIQQNIMRLSNFGVFDSVSFGLKQGTAGYIVVLRGFASRPSLKKSAERATERIEMVESVVNEIEVLPTSPRDENLRMAVFLNIYQHPTLIRYNPNRGAPTYGAGGWSRAATIGISNDPPQGYHPISILVNRGNVTLEGAVDTDGDKQIAGLQANSTPGVFSVTNNLQVLNPGKKKKK
jgi:hypothetical protein